MKQCLITIVTFLITFGFLEASSSSSSSSSASSSSSEESGHHTRKSKDNFFPYARIKLIPAFQSNNAAVSLLAEAGPKNYRVNGTLGFFTSEPYRFKIGAEYLDQEFRYGFGEGRHERWIQQFAFGGKYQYWLERCGCGKVDCDCQGWIKAVQVNANYSHVIGRKLHTFVDSEGTFSRRTSPSVYWSGDAGLIFAPWECSRLFLGVSYDNIRYHRKYQNTKRLSGVGCCVDYIQKLRWNLVLDVKAQFKRPYNYVEALLNWNRRFHCGDLSVGVFGSHVWGNAKLPDSSSAGGELRYAFGIEGWNLSSSEGCDPCTDTGYFVDSSELAAWVADPAVYRPQSLSIGDERFKHL